MHEQLPEDVSTKDEAGHGFAGVPTSIGTGDGEREECVVEVERVFAVEVERRFAIEADKGFAAEVDVEVELPGSEVQASPPSLPSSRFAAPAPHLTFLVPASMLLYTTTGPPLILG